ncbi:hypothetical protein N665_0164s0032, partial [Sinapis alba]
MGGESNDPNQTNARKETRCKWSPTEDGVLISAYFCFWKRIIAYYSSSLAVASLPKREPSKDDVVQVAYQFYFSDYNTKFTLEHAWRELCHDQKWCNSYSSQNSKSGGSSKRTKLDEGGTFSSSSNTESNVDEQFMSRPLGVKSSKRKEKKVVTKTTHEERESNSRSRLEN